MWNFLLTCRPEDEELIDYCVNEDINNIKTWLGMISMVNNKYVVLIKEFVLKKRKNRKPRSKNESLQTQ